LHFSSEGPYHGGEHHAAGGAIEHCLGLLYYN
jgi:hypothetical protein